MYIIRPTIEAGLMDGFIIFVISLALSFAVLTQNGVQSLASVFHAQALSPLNSYPSPSPAIQTLADNATMTQYAKEIFYSTQPVIDTDRATFNAHCQTPVSSDGVELGCYTSDNRIYILSITNPALSDEMVVTASHEMLHAAYARLSDNQRLTIDQQLEQILPRILNGQLAGELRIYRQTEPGQRDNELHSILGTEYTIVGPTLESYYSQYFTNRQTVVSFAQQFNQTFSNLEYDLATIRQQIKRTRQEMMLDIRQRNITGYNALVSTINALVRKYNNDVTQYNELSRSLLGTESSANSQ